MTRINGEDTLHLPRILCLHGGGVNAEVFEVQCRAIIARLRTTFRLVFMNGPFLSAPHPAIVTVYGSMGPFRRWLRWQPDHPEISDESAAQEIQYNVEEVMENDPGTGEWVGILGFSQGAKVSASLLWTQQKIVETLGVAESPTHFKFGILMAGRGPLLMLDPRLEKPQYVVGAGHLSSAIHDLPDANEGPHVLGIPTLHVHGLRDPGLEQHQILMDTYCQDGSTRLVEWDGDHRLPIKTHDVEAVVGKMLEMAKETGAIPK
ncbi:Fc.00g009610.m01.CDS01 [Cosmosporella sp. VM-42]